MAKLDQGILAGFSGKVGTVVGFIWKGKPVIRGYKRIVHDKHSEEQMVVRMRFATINDLAQAFRPATLLGLKNRSKARHNTEGNQFVQLNWDAVRADNTAEVKVDYAALQLSAGALPPVLFGAAQFDDAQTVSASFAPASGLPGTSDQDLVYLFVYNPSLNMGLLSDAATRTSRKATVSVPATWTGETVHVWGFVVGDGNENRGLTSASAYLGSGEIG